MSPRVALLAWVCVAGACATTMKFDPPPRRALYAVTVDAERRDDSGVVVQLRNRSQWNVQFVDGFVLCSEDTPRILDDYPWTVFEPNDETTPWMYERVLEPGQSATLGGGPQSIACLQSPHSRVGVFFKHRTLRGHTFRMLWSEPVGTMPTGA